MIRSLLLQPLGPALILALGGLLLWLASRFSWRYAWGRPRGARRRLRRPLALLIVAAASWSWLRVMASSAGREVGWRWQPLTVAGAPLRWQMDGWNGLAVLLLLLLTAALLFLDEDEPTEEPIVGSLERTLWLAAAAIVFVCSANMLTVASSWPVLDALLVLRLYPGRQKEPAGRTWGLLAMTMPLLLFVVVLLGEAGLPAPLIGGRFGRQELALLWLLGLMRTGVYPFHFWLTAPGHGRAGPTAAGHLIGPVAGIWFLARVQALAGAELTRRPEWVALGALALLGSAMAAWLAGRAAWRWRWIAINRASVVLLAAYVSAVPGPATFAWPLLAFGLGAALLAVGLWPRGADGAWRWPALVGALVLWGMPGTVGFLARSALIFPTELALAAPLFGVVLVSETLLVAALWENVRRPEAAAIRLQAAATSWAVRWRVTAAVALLVVPAIGWGLFPQHLAGLVGFSLPEAGQNLAQIIATSRRSVWIGLVLAAGLGTLLGLWRDQLFQEMRGWQRIIGQVVSLEWLYRGAVAGLRLLGSGLHYFATLGEGEGYLGWLALAGLILGVLLQG